MIFLTILLLNYGVFVSNLSPLRQDSSKVIIFRGGSYIAQSFDLWVNDQPILEPFKQNTTITLTLPPGDVKLATKRGSSWGRHAGIDYVIELEAGHTYYLQAELEYDFPTTYLALTVSNSEKYSKMLPKLKEIDY